MSDFDQPQQQEQQQQQEGGMEEQFASPPPQAPQQQQQQFHRRSGASFSILVKNIPADVAEHELTEIFRAYGTVLDVYLPKDVYTRGRKSFGFIEFDNQESANEAVDKMHGQMLRNNALICELAKHQRKSSRNATNNVLQELYLQQEQLLKTQTRDKLRAHRARHEQAYGELEAYANQLEWQLQAQFELTQSTLEQCDLDLQANEKEWNEYVNELSLEFDSKLVVMKNEVDLLQDDNVELTRQVASLHSELRRQQWRHQQEMDLLRKQHVQQQDELDRQMQALQQVTAHEQQRKLAQALQDVQL